MVRVYLCCGRSVVLGDQVGDLHSKVGNKCQLQPSFLIHVQAAQCSSCYMCTISVKLNTFMYM